ncbi:pseudouridine synthase, partial [Treponema sp.]|uniref:pseudouridine synthase n=1 Tax=Treponema sp. TaxID=166 RepID=UPI00388ECBAB
MFPPFSEEKASRILKDLILSLQKGGIELVQTSRPSEERKNQGVMLGSLVCKDKDGNEVNLITNSGNAKKLKNNPQISTDLHIFIIVDSIVSSEQIEEALAENDAEIHEITDELKNTDSHRLSVEEKENLIKLREKLCTESLEKVHALYNFHCIDGKVRSLKEICAEYNHGKLPPTGTGDCCAPKLLDYAFSHELFPVSLAETVWTAQCGRDSSTAEGVRFANGAAAEVRIARPEGDRPTSHLTPPCDERCGILLPAMLGLHILYRDDAICVVNKQSGVLSVPGRTEDKKDCIESRFKTLFGDKVEIVQSAVHRLDMETSGVMILAFTKEAHRALMKQFEAKEVHKEYIALLDGVLAKK